MNNEFFLPARYAMAKPQAVEHVAGGLIFPAGVPAPSLMRRHLSKAYPHLVRRLFDPQIYLSALSAAACRKVCVNLASYGWFPTAPIEAYDSRRHTQAEWKRAATHAIPHQWVGANFSEQTEIEDSVRNSISFQMHLGCEAVIIPGPLTNDGASDFQSELRWIDAGLLFLEEQSPMPPYYATVAVTDSVLRNVDPYSNDLITVIVDQLTARSLYGVYIIIEQTNENGYYCVSENTVGSLLRLVYELKAGGIRKVLVGPFGTAAFLGIAAGADSWSAGWYRGARRIKLADFQDQDGGAAVPTFYSHRLASEISLDRDLDQINEHGLLDEIADWTPASEGLLLALGGGRTSSELPEWQYSRSNVATATEHFYHAVTRETQVFSGKTFAEGIAHCRNWLETADSLAIQLRGLGLHNSRTELRHQASWLTAFNRFTSRHGL